MKSSSAKLTKIPSAKAFNKGFVQGLMHIILRIAVHALMLLPIFYVNFWGKFDFISRKMQLPFAFLLSLVIYIFICLPTKSFFLGFLCSSARNERGLGIRYLERLKISLRLLLRKLPFVLPLFALICYSYYVFNIAPFSKLGSLLNAVGSLFGGSLRYGLLAVACVFIISALLFIIGSYRFMGVHFLSNSTLEYSKLLRTNRATLTINRGAIARACLINLLLALPALILVILSLYMEISPQMTEDIKINLVLINKKLNSLSFSSQTNLSLLLTLIIAYIPLRILRKIRLARAFALDYDKA